MELQDESLDATPKAAGEGSNETQTSQADDHYSILGVARNATAKQLSAAYKKLSMIYHPERPENQNNEVSQKMYRRINDAFQTLSDPFKRKQYDDGVSATAAEPAADSVSVSGTSSGAAEPSKQGSQSGLGGISKAIGTLMSRFNGTYSAPIPVDIVEQAKTLSR